VADAVMVAEVMALAFIQVGGLLCRAPGGTGVLKTWVPVAARQDLAEIRAELGLQARDFLERHADAVREMFANEFGLLYPGFAQDYKTAKLRPPHGQLHLWDVVLDESSGGDPALAAGSGLAARR